MALSAGVTVRLILLVCSTLKENIVAVETANAANANLIFHDSCSYRVNKNNCAF